MCYNNDKYCERWDDMYKICQTEQSYRRQRELEQGLLQLMLRRRYDDISVSDLCAHLQIPRKAFYRYFSSKDGALYALLDHTMMDFQFSDRHGLSGSAPGELDRYFSFWYEKKDLLNALTRSSLSGILVERATNFALKERMMPRYMLSWDTNYQGIAISFAICGLMSMVIQWHQQNFQQTPEEMTKIATAMLTRPLLPT